MHMPVLRNGNTLLWLILCFPVGLTKMWKNSCTWKNGVKYIVSAVPALALAFVLILGILLAAPMRAGQEDRLIPGVRSVRMDPGDTYTLQYTLRADQAQAVSFSSEDSSIAEVSADGLVTAIAPGRTRLRLLARGGASATVDVEVSGVPVTLFELNTRELVMEKGDVSGLSCRFNQGATDQRVEWMSSNPDIVRVDAAGRVTAVSAVQSRKASSSSRFSPASISCSELPRFTSCSSGAKK